MTRNLLIRSRALPTIVLALLALLALGAPTAAAQQPLLDSLVEAGDPWETFTWNAVGSALVSTGGAQCAVGQTAPAGIYVCASGWSPSSTKRCNAAYVDPPGISEACAVGYRDGAYECDLVYEKSTSTCVLSQFTLDLGLSVEVFKHPSCKAGYVSAMEIVACAYGYKDVTTGEACDYAFVSVPGTGVACGGGYVGPTSPTGGPSTKCPTGYAKTEVGATTCAVA